MKIYEIKKRTEKSNPSFFSKNALKFFGQKMNDFHVKKTKKSNLFYIYAQLKDYKGTVRGLTERLFDSNTNELLFVEKDEFGNIVFNNEIIYYPKDKKNQF